MGDARAHRRTASVAVAACLVVSGFAFATDSVGADAPMGALNVAVDEVDPTGRIAAGDAHACAIATDGAVWCWGDNTTKQLGDADFNGSESLTPRLTDPLPAGRVADRIVAGKNHTCVLADDGTVWCWGSNDLGQLGVAGGTALTPTRVVLPLNAVTLGAGGNSTCAELTDGTARCWGSNSVGQWGDGTTSNVAAPGSFGTVSGVRANPGANEFAVAGFSAGPLHVCAVSDAGDVWCWGSSANGRLGSSSLSDATTPRRTAALPTGTARQVAAGHGHTCVVMSTGSLPCFGHNDAGQIGRDPNVVSDSDAPVAVTAVTASRVATGQKFTCVVASGAVSCFGSDNRGQLGDGAGETSGHAPRAVVGISGTVVDVVAGFEFACAVTSVGEVWCWGANSLGQLGLGNTSTRTSAVAVAGLAVNPSTTTTTTTTTTSTTTTTTTSTVPVTVPVSQSTAPESVSTTTAPPSSTTTASPVTTTAPTPPSEPSTTVRSTSTTSVAQRNSPVASPRSRVLRVGRVLSAAQIAGAVNLAIPRRSQGTMRISISTGRRHCVFAGSAIRGSTRGACTVTVVLTPRSGRSVVRTLKVQVR